MADGSARGGAIPMRSLRLVPYWSVHETLGVDAHNAPLKMRRRRIRLSRAVAWSCVRRHPVAGAALGSTDVEGSDPPDSMPRSASRRVDMCTHLPPSPVGSLPARYPSGKGFQRRCQAADHPVRRPSSRCVGATAKDPGGELGTGPTVGGTAPATGNGGP